jgi:hypothetical protein
MLSLPEGILLVLVLSMLSDCRIRLALACMRKNACMIFRVLSGIVRVQAV